jgi:hypothetical protein
MKALAMDGRYSRLLLRPLSGLFIALTVGAGGDVAWFLLRYPIQNRLCPDRRRIAAAPSRTAGI